jgi:hypothetical protein
LKPERPALGQFVQPCRGVVIDGGAETAVHQSDRFAEIEAQLRRADHEALVVVDEIVDAEMAIRPGCDDDAQVGWGVPQQVGQCLD